MSAQASFLKSLRDNFAEHSATAQIIDNENFARINHAESNLRVAEAALAKHKAMKPQTIADYAEAQRDYHDYQLNEHRQGKYPFAEYARIRALERVVKCACDMENCRKDKKMAKTTVEAAKIALAEVNKEAVRKEANVRYHIELVESCIHKELELNRARHGEV